MLLSVWIAASKAVITAFTAEQVATIHQWSDPFHFIVYLAAGLVLAVVFYQWRWTKESERNALLEVVTAGGRAHYELVPLEGGSVSLTNKNTKVTRTWPINELTTITVPYPGVAFIPKFLQKEIKMIGVNEEDWEPFTNRSPHRKNIVSPDVLLKLENVYAQIQTTYPELDPDNLVPEGESHSPKLESSAKTTLVSLGELVAELKNNASTWPTRELIASPAVLGNLLHERVTEVVTALGSTMMTKLEDVIKQLSRLGKPLNAMLIYILIALVAIIGVVGIYFSAKTMSQNGLIEKALGIENVPAVHTTVPTVTTK